MTLKAPDRHIFTFTAIVLAEIGGMVCLALIFKTAAVILWSTI